MTRIRQLRAADCADDANWSSAPTADGAPKPKSKTFGFTCRTGSAHRVEQIRVIRGIRGLPFVVVVVVGVVAIREIRGLQHVEVL